MDFEKLLMYAKQGDNSSQEELFTMYLPLIISQSMVDGCFSEDLFQELSKTFLVCIQNFDFDKVLCYSGQRRD